MKIKKLHVTDYYDVRTLFMIAFVTGLQNQWVLLLKISSEPVLFHSWAMLTLLCMPLWAFLRLLLQRIGYKKRL